MTPMHRAELLREQQGLGDAGPGAIWLVALAIVLPFLALLILVVS